MDIVRYARQGVQLVDAQCTRHCHVVPVDDEHGRRIPNGGADVALHGQRVGRRARPDAHVAIARDPHAFYKGRRRRAGVRPDQKVAEPVVGRVAKVVHRGDLGHVVVDPVVDVVVLE